MSVVQEERNELLKRFGNKALIKIEDSLYSVDLLKPNSRNRHALNVHPEAVERLNATMQRHIDGNAQIYVTMVYKGQPREKLIQKWTMGLLARPEFKALPERLKQLEIDQCQHLGPTSRYSIETYFDGFTSHIDEEAKTRNTNLNEYREAAQYFAEYIIECIDEAKRLYPDKWAEVVRLVQSDEATVASLPHDKVGGDPLFINVDRKIGGEVANNLYRKLVPKIKEGIRQDKQTYYVMYGRIQNKGNNFIRDDGSVDLTALEADPWKPEKNRVVQADSRSWQDMLKPISNLITAIPKLVSAIFCGWLPQEKKNEIFAKSLKEFFAKWLFDSFDAVEYDASTDPENFRLGLGVMWKVFRHYFADVNLGFGLEDIITHYLNDGTLTPWGCYERDSTPSGHNFTGPNGTVTNMLRAYVQTKRMLQISYQELNKYLHECDKKGICVFACVGDDAYQLRAVGRSPESIAEENIKDGYQNNAEKIILARDYVHFLQHAYFYDGRDEPVVGYYPVSRVVEHGLFQERANQYSAEEVSTQALVQNINNARFNPLQDYLIDYFIEGDKKYRLGANCGVINLFKAAAGDRTVAEFLNRSWDPVYTDMSWEQYSEVLRGTIEKIESRGRKVER